MTRLAQDLKIKAGTVLEQPAAVRNRYVEHPVPVAAPITPTAATGNGEVMVSGTTTAGASVVIAATLSPPGATDPNGTAHGAPVPTEVQQLTVTVS